MIQTERLLLRPPQPEMAAAVADFYRRNQAHLAPWDPRREPTFYEPAQQAERLARSAEDIEAGTLLGWWMFEPQTPERAIGNLHFSQIARGVSHSAMLGYSLDAEAQGFGLMAEALRAALAEVFGERVRLHRVQANARPENLRSLALLERLGFRREGVARQYLFIDGAWRDHVMTALINPAPGPW